MSDEMIKYYRDRAKEYEQVYEWRDPERQREQDYLDEELKDAFKNLDLLDIGCGTGYWTQRISMTAKSITGVDINSSVLEIAEAKKYSCPTEFILMDAYCLDFRNRKFNGALASFWLSHVRREAVDSWIEDLHKVLNPGATVFIVDNTYIEGVGGRLVEKTGDPNTYKLRTLNDGSQHMIVKNYYGKAELVEIFSRHTKGVSEKNVFYGNCFWWIKYKLNN